MRPTLEASTPTVPKPRRGIWMFLGIFGILSILRGIDHLADGHPVMGWLMVVCGAGIIVGLAWTLWRSRSARRTTQSS
jgi:hypothetical protein